MLFLSKLFDSLSNKGQMFQERIDGDSEVANLCAGEDDDEVTAVYTESPAHFGPRRLDLHPEGVVDDCCLALITEWD